MEPAIAIHTSAAIVNETYIGSGKNADSKEMRDALRFKNKKRAKKSRKETEEVSPEKARDDH